jgi:hypothetical protein
VSRDVCGWMCVEGCVSRMCVEDVVYPIAMFGSDRLFKSLGVMVAVADGVSRPSWAVDQESAPGKP